MKLLLTTIESDCRHSDLDLKYLYSVIADSPMDVVMKAFPRSAHYMDIYEEIVRGKNNIVYFHCDSMNEHDLLRIASMVKKATPSTAVMFGGMQVSFDTAEFMSRNSFVDYVIRGEGEKVLYNFVKSLLEYEFDFETIAGLAYREGDKVVVNPYDSPIEMDQLPFTYDRFEIDKDIVYYESIRGTSDRSVCSQHLPDPRVRALGLGRVCTELRYFLACEVKKVVFLDRWFNYNSERAYRLFEYIIHNDNGVTAFEFNINADELDEETIRLLSEARKGQISLIIDVATTNPDVLAMIGRNENIYRLMYNTTKLLQNGNVRTDIHITAGLPLETMEMFSRSFNKVYGLAEGMPMHIDSLYLSKGTALRRESQKFSYVYSDETPYEVIATNYMSAGEMLRIRSISRVVESYIGDGDFRYSIPRILNDTGIKPFDLFKSLESFINRNNLNSKLRKKENLARILYAFAEGLYEELSVEGRLEILKEVIYEDLVDMIPEEAMRKFDRKGWGIDLKGEQLSESAAPETAKDQEQASESEE